MKSAILAAFATLMALSAVAQPTAPPPAAEWKRAAAVTGKMTYYTPGQGSCGVTNSETDMIVAVSPAAYGSYANPNASPMCHKTVTITCSGGKTVKAAVRDRCAGCAANDLDVSPAVFKACGPLSVGAMTVSWAAK